MNDDKCLHGYFVGQPCDACCEDFVAEVTREVTAEGFYISKRSPITIRLAREIYLLKTELRGLRALAKSEAP
jgi:hypothetical protein